jgi:hypothetical protein
MKPIWCLIIVFAMKTWVTAAPLAQLFPASNVITGWTTNSAVAVYDTSNIETRIDGGIIPFEQHGFQQAGFQVYKNNTDQINMEIYDQTTPAGALAMYHFFLPTPVVPVLTVGDSSWVDKTTGMFTYTMEFYRQQYYCIIICPNTELLFAEALKIATFIDNAIVASPVTRSNNSTTWGGIKSQFQK